MILNKWLESQTNYLSGQGILTARLDCLVLLEDALKKDKSWILAHPEYVCQGQTLTLLDGWVKRRAGHEPLAYIRGKSEFYGREFIVDKHTLQPRPETETIISLVDKLIKNGDWRLEIGDKPLILDVGTGSGCIAITIKLEHPAVEVVGTDISKECLKIANKSAEKHHANVEFYQGNLLEPFSNLQSPIPNLFAILANLPYVPDKHAINQSALHEPKIAIFGGPDGLDLYRQMFAHINSLKIKPSFILTESLPFQHSELSKIAESAGYKQKVSEDLIQVFAG